MNQFSKNFKKECRKPKDGALEAWQTSLKKGWKLKHEKTAGRTGPSQRRI